MEWIRHPVRLKVASVPVGAALVLVALLPRVGRIAVSPFIDAAPVPPASPVASPTALPEGERSAGGGGGFVAGSQPRAASHAAPAPQSSVAEPAAAQRADGPSIARWARLDIVASRFDDVNPAIDRILADVKGFAGNIDATAARGTSRALRATLRIPASSLDAAMASLKRLGHVEAESRGGDDVTEQVVDIAARLANARNTEVRLTDVLRNRTGKVSEVLEAEREIARVRGEIEQLDAERKNLDRRVTYATLTLNVSEEPKAALDIGPLPLSARYRNAIVDGLRSAFEGLLEVSLVILRLGPSLAAWVVVLFWPARILLRRVASVRPRQ
jgi:hypothetical protein